MSRLFAFGWLKSSKQILHGSSKPARGRKGSRFARCRPRLEVLEDRTLLSTLTVTSFLDDGSSGTLRSNIAAASSGDTIQFAPELEGHTITLKSGELMIAKNLDVEGPGPHKLAISGDNASRIFDIGGSATVTIAGLTIADGGAEAADMGGGGIVNESGATLSSGMIPFTPTRLRLWVAASGIKTAPPLASAAVLLTTMRPSACLMYSAKAPAWRKVLVVAFTTPARSPSPAARSPTIWPGAETVPG